MTWYIDSWAVLDGIAFASLRQPNSIKADATVFLSVPDLEPVPMGRISTALRAQRNCFQDRFCDEYGNEFVFENLAQVQETIRRAYLAGGLAPTPAPLKELPIEPLLSGGAFAVPMDFPRRSGGAYFEEELKRLAAEPSLKSVQIDYSILQDPIQRKKILESLHLKSTPGLYAYVKAFGEATLIEFLYVRHNDLIKPEVRKALSQWIGVLYSAGLWDSTYQLWEFLGFAGLTGAILGGQPPWVERETWLPVNSPIILARKDSVFHIPCPLRSGWDKQIKSLHHKMLLPLADRSYFAGNKEAPEFVPLLFCSLVVAAGPALRATPSLFQASDRHRLMGRALLWITTELPSMTLPEGVDQALTDFAWAQLHRNSPAGDVGPVPPKVGPSGNPPLNPAGSTSAPIPRYAAPAKLRHARRAKVEHRRVTSYS